MYLQLSKIEARKARAESSHEAIEDGKFQR
jgi:hypothetical protein